MLPTNTKIIARADDLVLSLDEVRSHLSLFGNTEFDTLLTELVVTAGQLIEAHTGEYPVSTELQSYWASLSLSRFTLPITNFDPTTTVTMQYVDDSNATVSVPSTDFIVDTSGNYPAIVLTSTISTSLSRQVALPVSITFTTAINASYIEPIRQAALIYVSEMFYNRESFITGTIITRLPITATRLLARIKPVII